MTQYILLIILDFITETWKIEKAYNLQGNLHVPVATWSEQSANERYNIDLIDYKLIYNVTNFRETLNIMRTSEQNTYPACKPVVQI